MSSIAEQPCYTLINIQSDSEPPSEMQLKADLEKGDMKAKTEALKKTIQMILNGEKMPSLLMTIIRFVMPSQDHMIKKLLLIFWEVVPKYSPDGKMLHEFILVCDAYRKDLQHPNEFIQGSTLRFLCKLKEPELLEPLMPAIRQCLKHRHSYVRRNAVLAIYTIFRNFDFLIPDAPELVAEYLEGEQDMSCKRNAFMMLIHADQERALNYLSSCIDQVTSFGDILQLVIVELIYKVRKSRVSSTDKDRAMFETLYSFCTFVVWITFRRKDYEVVKKEIGRMLRSDTFNPAIRVKNAPEEKETEKKEEKQEGGKKEVKVETKLTPAEYRRLHPKRPAIKSIIHLKISLLSNAVQYASMLLFSSPEHKVLEVCHANPSERARFIRCIYNLLNSSSPAVRYEAAGTLVTLSSAPTAIKAAASCYIELIVKESDNNVKLIVLDRLVALKEVPAHEKVLQELVMDILRVLSAPDQEVRKKTLNLALDLVTSRSVEEMVLVLKKEVVKTNNIEHEDTGKYRQLLVRTLHQLSIKFPDIATTIIPVLIEFLGDNNEAAAADVLVFVREAIHRFEPLRNLVITKLLDVFSTIKAMKIHRAALWILGEYCISSEDIQSVMTLVRQSLGEIPIVDDELKKASGEVTAEDDTMTGGNIQKLVTADGTYATQSAFSTVSVAKKEEKPPLRQYLMDGDFFVGAALATTLTKLALRYITLQKDSKKQNAFLAESMLIMATVIHLGKSGIPTKPITDDDVDRIATCLRVLSEQTPLMSEVFNDDCRNSLSLMLAAKQLEEKEAERASERKVVKVQADDPIPFAQLINKSELGATENMFELTLSQALGMTNKKEKDVIGSTKLNKVTQLTGFSDPVYAEAYVNVNQFDIVLDVLVVNQTADTLQNLTLELATLGDLKLVEKPQPLTMAPHDFCNIKANVKVASTENGIIFGNIVYDVSGAVSDRNCVVLNDIHIDIMDYIVPASCNDTEFRQMWAEFEWENKVAVNTNISGLKEFLEHVIQCTNMKCLTPEKALQGDCGFMAANLYAKSIFGEDVLANLSIEKPAHLSNDAPVQGHIRIRAKSQGMALSMGDKINLSQKANKAAMPEA